MILQDNIIQSLQRDIIKLQEQQRADIARVDAQERADKAELQSQERADFDQLRTAIDQQHAGGTAGSEE